MSQNHAYAEHLIQGHHDYAKLFAEHQKIEEQIHKLKAEPIPHEEEVRVLKRQRLRLVDGMIQIEKSARSG